MALPVVEHVVDARAKLARAVAEKRRRTRGTLVGEIVARMLATPPPLPCEITTSGKALPSTGPAGATLSRVAPSRVVGRGEPEVGYQMPSAIGRPSGAAACTASKPTGFSALRAVATA
jgi:hypothetical protein